MVRKLGNQDWALLITATRSVTGNRCIGVTRAAGPAGPWTPDSSPLKCSTSIGGAIDPDLHDEGGTTYLYYSEGDPARIRVQQVNAQLTATIGSPTTLLHATVGAPDHGHVENPDMRLIDGQRYLFYSRGEFDNSSYSQMYLRCSSPTACNTAEPIPLLVSDETLTGPGGGAVSKVDGVWTIFFHNIDFGPPIHGFHREAWYRRLTPLNY